MSEVMDQKPRTSDTKTGVQDTKALAGSLSDVLADTYRLIFKTHVYHWNVTGPLFYSIHKLTETQYENMFAAADKLAERIRSLGELTPMKFADIAEYSAIDDLQGIPTARDMVEDLASDHQHVARRLHNLIELAGKQNDPVSDDLATGRAAFHEEAAWMLRAIAAE